MVDVAKEWRLPRRRPVTQEEIDLAVARDADVASTEFRATAVSYDAAADRLSFVLPGGAAIAIPRVSIDSLAALKPADLAGLRLWPDGVLLELPDLDVHLHVPRILARAVEDITPPAVLSAMFARLGGTAKSDKKRLAAIENGKRGGRKPKKAA